MTRDTAAAGTPEARFGTGNDPRLRRFRTAYARHRAVEGRGAGGADELLVLPYFERGPQAAQWAVRSRTFDRFVALVLRPAARAAGRPLRVLDLGAGNGWLCWRVGRMGHHATAIDLRDDRIDGLGAAAAYADHLPSMFGRIAASFEATPLRAASFDVAVFNAALHYALDLRATLAEATRVVRPGGRIAVLDSPFYRCEADGLAMVEEKRRDGARRFGAAAEDLLALPFIEFLTRERLAEASAPLGLSWRRHRVRYPWRYELRPVRARLARRRPPSRFDLWEAIVP